MTTDPQTDRPRALHLLEAADFLRDAHFRDGLTVQEIGTALRHMADEADPMVGSLARDGFGLDEIAAMPVAPAAVPPADRAAGLTEAERTMLTYALDQAQEKIWSEDGFTDEDQAAVDSLRQLAAGTPQPETQAARLSSVQTDGQSCPHCAERASVGGTVPAVTLPGKEV